MALSRIKTREGVKDIKVLDKAAVVSERMKTALVRSKDQAENLMDDGQISPSEYAEDKIRYAAEDVTDQFWHEVSGQTKKAIERGKEAHREHRNEKRIHKNEERVRRYEEELRRDTLSRTPREEAARQAARQNTEATRTNIRSRRNQTIKSAERTERTIKQSARSAGKQTVKAGAKGTVKSTERAVKTAEKTSKAAIKTAEATAKATQKAAAAAAKAAQKAAEIARQDCHSRLQSGCRGGESCCGGNQGHCSGDESTGCGYRCRWLGCGRGRRGYLPCCLDCLLLLWYFLFKRGYWLRKDNAAGHSGNQHGLPERAGCHQGFR